MPMHISPPPLDTLPESQRDQFNRLSQRLIEANRSTNLTRVTDPDEIRVRHFMDSLAALSLLQAYENQIPHAATPRLIDVGSGAGFPGLALAIALPHWQITSLEATGKKVGFQSDAASDLGLANFKAIQGRAEELGHDPAYREHFHVATARALAPLPVLAEIVLPFVAAEGHMVAWKGPHLDQERTAGRKACEALGARYLRDIPYTLSSPNDADTPDASTQTFSLVEIQRIQTCPDTYPRKIRAIRKHPLGAD